MLKLNRITAPAAGVEDLVMALTEAQAKIASDPNLILNWVGVWKDAKTQALAALDQANAAIDQNNRIAADNEAQKAELADREQATIEREAALAVEGSRLTIQAGDLQAQKAAQDARDVAQNARQAQLDTDAADFQKRRDAAREAMGVLG